LRVQEEYNIQMHDYFASYTSHHTSAIANVSSKYEVSTIFIQSIITNILHLHTWAQQYGQTIMFP
jgi:membrane protease subunit (stomatin/prohibitin family)